jgi:hypothetical protein
MTQPDWSTLLSDPKWSVMLTIINTANSEFTDNTNFNHNRTKSDYFALRANEAR